MRNALPWLAAGCLAFVALQQGCENRELRADSERADSLRAVVLEERAAAQGWRTQLVQATSGLEAQLMEARDREALLVDEKAELAREIQALGGRLAIMTDLYADARGQIIAHADVHGDSSSDRWTPESVPDSITAPVDDGLLSGRLAYFPAPQAFDLQYAISLGLTVAVSEAPDGRGFVTVMPERPDLVSLSYGEVLYQRPEPVQVCSLGQRAETAGWAVGIWELGKLGLSALGGG